MTQSIGPPSLAQGTRIAVGFSTSISRFIPACGELSKPSWAIVQLDGSSPLARGTQDLDRLGYVADRFTSAYAGNSWRLRYSCGLVPVHPRLRGELGLRKARLLTLHGSSPLTRGTHWRHYEFRFRCSVHPRLRGELLAAITGVSAAIGSSPLTRGTQAQPHIRADLTRFIPAYAGNSAEVAPPTAPRDGSSPLTRGTHFFLSYSLFTLRFIPAYAGNSLKDGINLSIHTLGI